MSRRHSRHTINADLQDVAHQIHAEFADQLDPGDVDECLDRIAAKFDDAKVRSFVPLLVRRYVRDELQERLKSAYTASGVSSGGPCLSQALTAPWWWWGSHQPRQDAFTASTW